MNSNKYTNAIISTQNNLIGEERHRHFLSLQAIYGLAQRGGVQFPFAVEKHSKRLISDINILSPKENKQLIFSEFLFTN